MGVAASQGVFYYAYEAIRESLQPASGAKRTFSDAENLVIGAVAGTLRRSWLGSSSTRLTLLAK